MARILLSIKVGSGIDKQKEILEIFKKDRETWINNLSDREKQESYEASKKLISEQFLTQNEYELRIEKIAHELCI